MACIAILGATACAAPAEAQKISARISSDRAVLGEVLTLQVTVSNPQQASTPISPRTDAFDIRLQSLNPHESSQVTIVNGRMTKMSSYTYSYQARPLRRGTLVIPPFAFKENGVVHQSTPLTVTVGEDQGGPFVLCEVTSHTPVAYVGEAVTLTLRVRIQRYQQSGYQPLEADSMWTNALIDTQATSWGVFAEADLSRPAVRQQRLRDDDGAEKWYYHFTVDYTVEPTASGPFDFGDIEFVYRYPIRLRRAMFGGLSLDRARTIAVRPELPDLLIKPIPLNGRPEGFSGAVGAYQIQTEAKPTEVPVGDPITLTMTITGTGPLERLAAPKLNEISALTHDFEVPGDLPAGEVVGRSKRFVVTLRALREDVAEIPPIPMSYFDPRTERFTTAMSRAIPLAVKPAERLALPTTPLSISGGAQVLAPMFETTEGLLANFRQPDEILTDQAARMGSAAWGAIIAFPLIYLTVFIVQARSARFRDDAALRRRSRAFATARRSLHNGAQAPGDVRGALIRYVADRANAPAGGLTRDEALRIVRDRCVPQELTDRLDGFLERLELAQYGGESKCADGDLAAAAMEIISALERTRW
jgi:hypothetical protein